MKLQFFFIHLTIFVLLTFSTATLFVMESESKNEEDDQVMKYYPTDEEKITMYTTVRYGKTKVEWVSVNLIFTLGKRLNNDHPNLFFNFYRYLREIREGKIIQIEKYPSLIYDRDRKTIEKFGLTLYGPSLPEIIVSMVHECRDATWFNKSKVVIGAAFELPFIFTKEKKITDYSRFFIGSPCKPLEEEKKYVHIRYGNTKVEWISAKEISKRVRRLHRDRADILYYLYLYSKRALSDEMVPIEKFSFLKDYKRRQVLEKFGLTVYGGLPLLVTVSMVYGLKRPSAIESEHEEIELGSPFEDVPFTNRDNVENDLSKKKKKPSKNFVDLTKKIKKKKLEQALINGQISANEFGTTLIKRLCDFQKRKKDKEKLNSFVLSCQKFHDEFYPLLYQQLNKLGLVQKNDSKKYSMITQAQTALLIGSFLERKNYHKNNLSSSQDLFNETIQVYKKRAKNQRNLPSKKDKEKEKLRLSNTSEDED